MPIPRVTRHGRSAPDVCQPSETEPSMMEMLREPWPWYIAGPLIGLMVPLLLLIGGKPFGISSNLRHLCAATIPSDLPFFAYDWKREGGWNLLFALGIAIGGFVAVACCCRMDMRWRSRVRPSTIYARSAFMTSRDWCRKR